MILKEDINEAKERMKAWWDHEIIDRPVIAYSYRKLNFRPSAGFNNWNLARDIDNIKAFCDKFLNHAKNQYYGGEKFPHLWPNYGPGIMAAVLGVIPEFKAGTVWFDRPTAITEVVSVLESAKLNANNEWYARLLRITQYAVDHSQGRYSVGLSDLGGILDILSSFLGPKELIVGMRRHPGIIDTCRAIILEKTLRVYDDLQKIIDAANLGCNAWLDVWCPKHWYPIQCDFSAMLSPKLFTQFVLPDLVAQAEHMDYAIYHLDGPNELKYVDELLAAPSITGIQWVPGVGEASMEAEKWFPLYKKFQEKGKNLVIDSSPMGASRLYKELDPHGLMVRCHMASRLDAKLYLPKFAKGWGDFFGKKPSKLGEEYMIPKSKFRLKMMNKFS
jgi:5-methyltetrahydrofolate--homocysteine methyltransferase